MESVEIIQSFATALLPVVSAIAGWMASKIRESSKREKEAEKRQQATSQALVDGVKSLLRGQIIDDGLKFLEQGRIAPYSLQSMENQYDAYTRLGDGDPTVGDIVAKCKQLDIVSGSEATI